MYTEKKLLRKRESCKWRKERPKQTHTNTEQSLYLTLIKNANSEKQRKVIKQ